jgi:hypothetical protein
MSEIDDNIIYDSLNLLDTNVIYPLDEEDRELDEIAIMKGEYPEFVKNVFRSQKITAKGKEKFRRQFLRKFMIDRKFRDITYHQYLLFLNGDYHSFVPHISNIEEKDDKISQELIDTFYIRIGNTSCECCKYDGYHSLHRIEIGEEREKRCDFCRLL